MVLFQQIKLEQARNYHIRCLVLGLDNAGKSSIVAKLFNKDSRDVAPTLGFNIKTMRIQRSAVDFWDVGGQKTLRAFWSNYFHAADALIWVVDSTDRQRLHICRQELEAVLGEERIKGSEVLILANKQDVDGALKSGEISQLLGLASMAKDRSCVMASCSAVRDSAESLQKVIVEDFLDKTRQRLHPTAATLAIAESAVQETIRAPNVDWNETVPTQDPDAGFSFETRALIFS